jgi:hypothetical protein
MLIGKIIIGVSNIIMLKNLWFLACQNAQKWNFWRPENLRDFLGI